MAQGVRIEQGLERRDVTPGADQPVRASKVEQATVPLAPVMAPRPSSFSAIGKSAAMMGEAMKWGSKFLEEQVDRENRKNLLEGQALYAQGKSLDDLQKKGVTSFTEHGWRLMDAQTSAATWNAAVMQGIDEKDYALSPDEFRTKITGMLSDATKGKDRESVNMIMAGSMKYQPGIMEHHLKSNFANRERQTFAASVNSVAGTAQSVMDTDGRDVGKADWLAVHSPNATKVNDPSQPFEIKGPMAQLKPTRYNEALTAGIQKAYEEDNPLAHTWAKEAGYLANLNGTQLAQVRSSEAEYYRRKENKFDAAVIAKEFDITEGLKTNKYDILTGIGMMRELYDQKGLKLEQADLRRVSSAAAAGAAEQRGNAEAELRRQRSEADAAAREAKREADNRADALAYGQYQISKVPIALAFQNKEITPEQYMDKLTKLGDDLKLKIGRGLTGEAGNAAMDAAMESLKNQAQREVIDAANSRQDLSGLKPELAQKALRVRENEITTKYLDKVAKKELSPDVAQAAAQSEFLDYWSKTGHIDEPSKKQFMDQLVHGSVLGADGKISDTKLQAFGKFMGLYDKNPDLAMAHISGDNAKAIMLGYLGSYRPGTPNAMQVALRDGEALRKVSEADQEKYAKAVQSNTAWDFGMPLIGDGLITVRKRADSIVNQYFEDQTPSVGKAVVAYATGNGAEYSNRAKMRDGLNPDAVEANKALISKMIDTRATTLMSNGTTRDPEIALKTAWSSNKDRIALVGDSVITVGEGSTIGERMYGKPGATASPWDAHDGLMAVIKQHGDTLWGKDIKYQGPGEKAEYGAQLGTEHKSDVTSTHRLFGGWDHHRVIAIPAADGLLVRLELGSKLTMTSKTTEPRLIPWSAMGEALDIERKSR